MKRLLAEKIGRMGDKDLLSALKGHPLHDWRNWGDNVLRLIAEEAHRRGLIQ